MKDWAFTTTVEEMEAATNALLETANKVGADTWQQRVRIAEDAHWFQARKMLPDYIVTKAFQFG